MNSATRTVTLAAAVIAGVAIGILTGIIFIGLECKCSLNNVHPNWKSLFCPAIRNTYAGRFEDKEAGVVCYVFNNKLGVSCVKK